MSCDGNRTKYFQEIAHQKWLAKVFGGADQAVDALERIYQAGRNQPAGDKAQKTTDRAYTLSLFAEMRQKGLKPPTHSKSGLPRADAQRGYAEVRKTLWAILAAEPMPPIAAGVLASMGKESPAARVQPSSPTPTSAASGPIAGKIEVEIVSSKKAAGENALATYLSQSAASDLQGILEGDLGCTANVTVGDISVETTGSDEDHRGRSAYVIRARATVSTDAAGVSPEDFERVVMQQFEDVLQYGLEAEAGGIASRDGRAEPALSVNSVDWEKSDQQPGEQKHACRCPVCQAFVTSDGDCNNPLCPSRFAEPAPGEAPVARNMWRWKRPAQADAQGDALRAKYNIPPDAVVEVSDLGHIVNIAWYDPQRLGDWGTTNLEFLNKNDGVLALALAHPDRSGQSGFFDVEQSPGWSDAHPFVVNPLVDAPGVSLTAVEDGEAALVTEASDEQVSADPYTFHNPASWEKQDYKSVEVRKQWAEEFLAMFPGDALDTPLDFTRGEDGYHLGVMSPRRYAAGSLDLWGIGGHGHSEDAKFLAELAGLTLVAEETCPMQLPAHGQANPFYLLDYYVDDSPIVGFSMDLNKHHAFAWPGDARDHHNGLTYINRLVGHQEHTHNFHNWVSVLLGYGKGTHRHDDVMVTFAVNRGEQEARQAVAVVAAALLRLGHDPDARLDYETNDGEVHTLTVKEAAEGHTPRPAPPAWKITSAGQEAMQSVAEPFTRWHRRTGVADDTNDAARAANELYQAAGALTKMLNLASITDPALRDRIAAFRDKRSDWRFDYRRMVSEFAMIKQAVHNDLRARFDVCANVFGAGFLRLFGK